MRNVMTVLAAVVGLAGVGGQAHALTKYQSSTKGNQAQTSVWSSNACGYEGVSVWAFEQDQRGSSAKTSYNSVYVDYYSYDFCAGTDRYGFAVIDGATFAQQKVDSASVSANTTMSISSCTYSSDGGGGMGGTGGKGGGTDGGIGGGSYTCSQYNAPLTIAAYWTGTGDTTRDRSTQSYSTPHARYRSRSSGQSRDATMSGSISVDNSNIDLSGAYGSLSIVSSGSFEMYH
ncbi:MAG TPA: hypothetical protein VF331_24215 [Polyangiales bacterium]